MEKIAEKVSTKAMKMNSLWWKELDAEAKKLSKTEKKKVSAQEVLRRIAKTWYEGRN